MVAQIRGYLQDLGRQLHLEPGAKGEVVRELETHLEDSAQEFMEVGLTPEEAYERALHDLGQPKGIARGIYSVHSRASWRETALATSPHLLFAFLFAFHLSTSIIWMPLLLISAAVMAFRGWRKGRPNWLYPWLGYCLIVSSLLWAMALASTGYGAWSLVSRGTLPLGIPIYIASLVYLPVSLWLVVSIFFGVIRRDWLLASLMAVPLPFLTYWLLYIQGRTDIFRPASSTLKGVDVSTALVFVTLAVITAIFLRIGQRLVKVALVLVTAPALAVLAWLSYQGGPGYLAMVFFAIVSIVFLLSPAILDGRLGDEPVPELLGEGEPA